MDYGTDLYDIFSRYFRRFRFRPFRHSPRLKIVLLPAILFLALFMFKYIRLTSKSTKLNTSQEFTPVQVHFSSQDRTTTQEFKLITPDELTYIKSKSQKLRNQLTAQKLLITQNSLVQKLPIPNSTASQEKIVKSTAQKQTTQNSLAQKLPGKTSANLFPAQLLPIQHSTSQELTPRNPTIHKFPAPPHELKIKNSTTLKLLLPQKDTTQHSTIHKLPIRNPLTQKSTAREYKINNSSTSNNHTSPNQELPIRNSTKLTTPVTTIKTTTEKAVPQLNIKTGLALFPLELEDFPGIVNLYRSGKLNESHVKPINLRYAQVNFSVNPPLNSISNPLTLLVIVKSARTNFWKRNIVRQTWGNPKYLEENTLIPHNISTRVFFICGKSDFKSPETESYLTVETGFHKDLIIANFNDSYFNNTYKSLLAFKWALTEFKGGFKFLALFDDDVFVDMLNLGAFLRDLKYKRVLKLASPTTGFPYFQITPRQDESTIVVADISNGLYIGNCRFSNPPMRYRKGKWYTTFEDYPYHIYPPYVPGAGMVLDYKAVSDMYYASVFVRHYWIDDVYLGIIAAKLGIIPFHEDYSQLNVFHGFSCPEQILDFWKRRDKLYLINCPK